jgi:hypothetical protein
LVFLLRIWTEGLREGGVVNEKGGIQYIKEGTNGRAGFNPE